MNRIDRQIAHQKRIRAELGDNRVVDFSSMRSDYEDRKAEALSVIVKDKAMVVAENERLNRCLRVIRAQHIRSTLTVVMVERAIAGERL